MDPLELAVKEANEGQEKAANSLAAASKDALQLSQATGLLSSVKSTFDSTPFWEDLIDETEDGVRVTPAPAKKAVIFNLLAHSDNPYIAAAIPTVASQLSQESNAKAQMMNTLMSLKRAEKSQIASEQRLNTRTRGEAFEKFTSDILANKAMKPAYRKRVLQEVDRQKNAGEPLNPGKALHVGSVVEEFNPTTEMFTPEEVENLVSTGQAKRDGMGILSLKGERELPNEELYNANWKAIGTPQVFDDGVLTIYEDMNNGQQRREFIPMDTKRTRYSVSNSNRSGGSKTSTTQKPRNANSAADAISAGG